MVPEFLSEKSDNSYKKKMSLIMKLITMRNNILLIKNKNQLNQLQSVLQNFE